MVRSLKVILNRYTYPLSQKWCRPLSTFFIYCCAHTFILSAFSINCLCDRIIDKIVNFQLGWGIFPNHIHAIHIIIPNRKINTSRSLITFKHRFGARVNYDTRFARAARRSFVIILWSFMTSVNNCPRFTLTLTANSTLIEFLFQHSSKTRVNYNSLFARVATRIIF